MGFKSPWDHDDQTQTCNSAQTSVKRRPYRGNAIDVAQTESGEWIVVELNDGQMSGLSENNPEVLYKNLTTVLRNKYQW